MRKRSVIGIAAVALMFGARGAAFAQKVAIRGDFVLRGSVLIGYLGSGREIVIPADIGVAAIGNQAFSRNKKITSVTIPQGVTGIGDYAFVGCLNLTSVTIPASVASIGKWVFGDCDGLTEITVDPENTVYCSINGVLFDKSGETLIQCPGGKIGTFVVPTEVVSVGNDAFYGCSNIKSVILSRKTHVDSNAFPNSIRIVYID
jgi:hypothetical protein